MEIYRKEIPGESDEKGVDCVKKGANVQKLEYLQSEKSEITNWVPEPNMEIYRKEIDLGENPTKNVWIMPKKGRNRKHLMEKCDTESREDILLRREGMNMTEAQEKLNVLKFEFTDFSVCLCNI